MSQEVLRNTEERDDVWGKLGSDTTATIDALMHRHPVVRAVCFCLWTPMLTMPDKPNVERKISMGFCLPEDWTREEMIDFHEELALSVLAGLRRLRQEDSKFNEELGYSPHETVAKFLKEP